MEDTVKWLLWLLVFAGCMEQVDGYISDGRSRVYICDGVNAAGQSNEWCYPGSSEGLETLVDATGCHATEFWERTSVVGCWWHCDDAPGCNAHNGCAGCGVP